MKGKLKFLSVLLGFALATPILSACGEKSYGAVDRIVAKAPDCVVVGDTVDLDKYITVRYEDEVTDPNAAKAYKVEIKAGSEGICTLKNHMLTVKKEGQISLGITAGPKNDPKEAKFTCEAISALKAQFHNDTKELSSTFGFAEVSVDKKDNFVLDKNGDYVLEDYVKHNENYIWLSGWEYDTDGTTILSGGMLKTKEGNTYFYSISADGKNVQCDPAKMSDFPLYYINGDFNLPYTALETRKEILDEDDPNAEEVEFLYIDYMNTEYADAFDTFVSYNMCLNWADGYQTHSLYLMPYVTSTGKSYWQIYVFVSDTFTPKVPLGLAGIMVMYTDSSDCEVPVVAKYIEDGKEPEALKYDELTSAFDKLNNAKNYTLTSTTEFGTLSSKNAWTPLSNAAAEEYNSPSYDIVHGNVEVSKVNGTSMVTTVNGSIVSGYNEKDGNLYSFAPDASGYKATEDTVNNKLWDTSAVPSAIVSTNTKVFDASFSVNGNETKDGVTTIAMRGQDVTAFAKAVLSLSLAGKGCCDLIAKVDAQQTDGSTYWEAVDITVVISESSIVVTTDMQYDYDQATKTVTYLRIVQTFSKIGSTTFELPADIAYPAA